MEERALSFAVEHGLGLEERLGFGQDGEVYRTDAQTVLKVFAEDRQFEAEWEAYVRIEEAGFTQICGHAIPVLLRADFGRSILHLTIVREPFVLDFARATLGRRSETRWPADVWSECMAQWRTRFRSHQWPKVLEIREALGAASGVWMEDLHQGNIRFADSDETGDTPPSD